MSDFIQDCISGKAVLTNIDDYIEQWHEGNSKISLHEFLGMTLKEYAAFVADEDVLPTIVKAHKEGRDFNLVPVRK